MTTWSSPGAIAAEEEAGRVEHVAEASKVRDQRDLPAVRVHALAAQQVQHGRAHVVRRREQVVVVAERQQVRGGSGSRSEAAGAPRRARRGRGRRRRRRAPARTTNGRTRRCRTIPSSRCEFMRRVPRRGPDQVGGLEPGPAAVLVEAVSEVGSGEVRAAPALEVAQGGLRLERPERVHRMAHGSLHDDPVGADAIAGVDRHASTAPARPAIAANSCGTSS